VLRALVLALHDDARGDVRDPHGGVGAVDMLAARAAGAIRVDPKILFVDLDIDVVLHQGSPIHLRMGRDHIGPAVPGSDVVWRWRLRDEAPYTLARGALLATPQ